MLPAYAGMIPKIPRPSRRKDGAPRIRGDDPEGEESYVRMGECSPHTRG